MSLTPLKFLVHRVSFHPLEREVIHEGEEIKAIVNSIEIELVSLEGHGTLALRYIGHMAEEAKKLFTEGHTITWSIDITSNAPDNKTAA